MLVHIIEVKFDLSDKNTREELIAIIEEEFYDWTGENWQEIMDNIDKGLYTALMWRSCDCVEVTVDTTDIQFEDVKFEIPLWKIGVRL